MGYVNEMIPRGRHRGAPEYVTEYFDQDWGHVHPSGSVPMGTEVCGEAKGELADGWLFEKWSAAGSLIDGSLEVQDWFLLTNPELNQNVQAVYTRCALEIPVNSAYLTITASGSNIHDEIYDVDGDGVLRRFVIGPPGTVVMLEATTNPPLLPITEWKVDWAMSGVTPRYSASDTIQVVLLPNIEAAMPRSPTSWQDLVTVTTSATEGGRVLGATSTGHSGVFTGPFITTSYYNAVTLTPVPDPGYEFAGWDPPYYGPTTNLDPDDANNMRAKFEMEDKTTLSVNVGGADPGCAGYVTIENAKKHFNLTELVTLTAHPSPGYAFNGWDGHFVDIQGRRPGQIGKTEPQITLMMSEDWNVVAVFREAIVDAKT